MADEKTDEKDKDEETPALTAGKAMEKISVTLERISRALEMSALAAWSTAQHQKCNEGDCNNGATRLALSKDEKAVVPVCNEHDRPKLAEVPARLVR